MVRRDSQVAAVAAEAGKEEENMTVDLEGDQRQIASASIVEECQLPSLNGRAQQGVSSWFETVMTQLAGGTLKVKGLKQLSLTEGSKCSKTGVQVILPLQETVE
ncbi:hypothetical protein PBY51_018329 [Eleginops maclovinus]|uniref:Uncharacterized protein n=1 Tax=Eleginops maclovinus TaxID=56733 RepID=A0AAN7Y8N7_ELEMC|nr:hypothetical protein PBY51_018329 [Eleginops maclovinus]